MGKVGVAALAKQSEAGQTLFLARVLRIVNVQVFQLIVWRASAARSALSILLCTEKEIVKHVSNYGKS